MVAAIDSTVANIRKKVRRLTASTDTLQLTNDDLDEYINTSYVQDMPAEIKSWLFKDVVEVFVQPNIDRYALSGTLAVNTGPNTYESIREPVYVEGRRAKFYKDRGQFYNDWPRTASLNTSLEGDGATTAFTLNIGAPILQQEIVIGYKSGTSYLKFQDDGDLTGTGTGQIVEAGTTTSVGTVVYDTGSISVNFTTPPGANEIISIWYYTYTTGRPYSVMWWKDEIIIRPVPDRVYRLEVEAYKYPTQFDDTTDTPTLKQWWQYISLLAAVKVLQDRQDMEGVQNLAPLIDRQETLIKNRIANEQIGQKNVTIYNGSEESIRSPFGYF